MLIMENTGLKITEVNDADGIQRNTQVWHQLQETNSSLTPWQTWEWNEAWWSHFGGNKRLKLLLFQTSSNEVVGIAPLCTARYLGTPVRRLVWVGTGQSDYLGVIAHPDYEEEVCSSLMTYLKETVHGWDVADLQQIRSQSVLGQIVNYNELDGESAMSDPCPFLSLPDEWKKLTNGLGKKMRTNIGYYNRLLQRTFPDTDFRLATEASLQDDLGSLFDLHQSRWKSRSLPGVLGSNRVQEFHRTVAKRFLANNWLRLHTLIADGQTIATLYCFAYQNRTYYYQGGFSIAHSRYSPGTVLLAKAIETAINEGHSEFDFLRGHEDYKYRWQPQERFNHNYNLVREENSLSGRAGRLLNRAERFVVCQALAYADRKSHKTPQISGASES